MEVRKSSLNQPYEQTLSYFCTELEGRTKTGRGGSPLSDSVSDLKPTCYVEELCLCREVRVWFQPQDLAWPPLQLPRHILTRNQKRV